MSGDFETLGGRTFSSSWPEPSAACETLIKSLNKLNTQREKEIEREVEI